MAPPTSLSVFCGASSGTSPAYLLAAEQVGAALARADCELFYGGGQLGLMGTVAGSCLQSGGKVCGVIPSAFLAKVAAPVPTGATEPELHAANGGHTSSFPLTATSRQIVVGSMHERKKIMATESCGFIGLPGGLGTLEECVEMATWTQLGIHKKPVVLLNVEGFYSPLREFIEGAIKSGFIAPANRAFLLFIDRPSESESFDWGAEALRVIEEWTDKGAGGGKQYALNWVEG